MYVETVGVEPDAHEIDAIGPDSAGEAGYLPSLRVVDGVEWVVASGDGANLHHYP